MAQSVEHRSRKAGVIGSNPIAGSLASHKAVARKSSSLFAFTGPISSTMAQLRRKQKAAPKDGLHGMTWGRALYILMTLYPAFSMAFSKAATSGAAFVRTHAVRLARSTVAHVPDRALRAF